MVYCQTPPRFSHARNGPSSNPCYYPSPPHFKKHSALGSNEICRNYTRGLCTWGEACFRRHPKGYQPPSPSIPINIPPRNFFSSQTSHDASSETDVSTSDGLAICSTPYNDSDTSSDESSGYNRPLVRLGRPCIKPTTQFETAHSPTDPLTYGLCPPGYCRDWCRGSCRFRSCRYLHEPHAHRQRPQGDARVRHPHPKSNEICWEWEHDRCSESYKCPFVHGDLQYDSPDSVSTSLPDEDSPTDGNRTQYPRPPNSTICEYWRLGRCHRGPSLCPFVHPDVEYDDLSTAQADDAPAHQLVHPRPPTTETCRKWLRGICNLGYDCKFLHQDLVYDEPIPGFHKDVAAVSRLDHSPSRPCHSNSEWTVFVHDHIRVKMGTGFHIEELVTGFETPWLFVQHLPAFVNDQAILSLLTPFGKVELKNVTLAAGSKSVKAKYADHVDARNAATSLDETTHFGQVIRAHLSIDPTSSGGTIKDCSIRISWDAPGLIGYAGYPTLKRAEEAIAVAQKPFRGRRVRASIYTGHPAVGLVTVKFWNLPTDIKQEKNAMKVFAQPDDMMWQAVPYASVKDSEAVVRKILNYHFDVLRWEMAPEPYIDGLVRAYADFATPLIAAQAADHLHVRKPGPLGGVKLFAHHMKSLTYKLSSDTYEHARDDAADLRNSLIGRDTGMAISHRDNKVAVKLFSDDLKELGRLKKDFERILRGETVMMDGKVAWDTSFDLPSGIVWFDVLRQQYSQLRIVRDAARRRITLYGPAVARTKAREAIIVRIRELHARTVRVVPLRGHVLGTFMVSQLANLKNEIGEENLTFDLWNRNLVVRGKLTMWLAAKDAVRRAEEMQRPSRTTKTCPICFDDVEKPLVLRCGHAHCRSCLREYLLAATSSRFFPLTCLGGDANCTELIPLPVARGILTTEEFNEVVNSAYAAYVAQRSEEFHHCPTPDCPQVYRAAPGGTVLQCPACLARICATCHGESHDGVECPDDENDENERAFKQWKEQHGVKPCPQCKVDIERAEGCNHVTCIRCNTHICWECLRTFPRGEGIYEHMRATHGSIGLIPHF